MSSSTGPGYVPYNKSKRLSTASVNSFTAPQSPPSSSANSRPQVLVRPASSPASATASSSKIAQDSPLRHPQPFRPAASTSFSHNGPNSPSSSGRPSPAPHTSAALPFQSVSPGTSPFPPATPNRTQSPAAGAASTQQQHHGSQGAAVRAVNGRAGEKTRAPYHSSFQPQGVRRDRTEEFMMRRKTRGESKKLEEGRLGRRLEKVHQAPLFFSTRADSRPSSWSLCISRRPWERARR